MMYRDYLNGESGFTLLDTLVSLVVAGLAGSILAGLVAFVDRNAGRLRADLRTGDALIATREVLRSLNQEAFSPAFDDPTGSQAHGTQEMFSIRTRGPKILGLDRAAHFQLLIEPIGHANGLTLTWEDPGTKIRHREIVVPNVNDATFSYFGETPGSDAPAWHTSWRSGDARLEALRLTIRTSTMRAAVDINIPLRATVPQACLRNPRHPGCPLSGS